MNLLLSVFLLRQLSGVLLLLLISSSPSIAIAAAAGSSTAAAKDIAWWCRRTPHRDPCINYLCRSGREVSPALANEAEFYQISVELAYKVAVQAKTHIQVLGRHCRSRRQRTAWLDCRTLYASAAYQLELAHLGPASGDAQTRLSAALTYLETCRQGFSDLAVSPEVIDPVLHYNTSDLISNCLAINKPPPAPPSWTAAAHRKLLQLQPAAANAVVAKDGSGKFRTIQSALDAAAAALSKNMNSSGRFVIYVKQGVYSENIQIPQNLTNIAMIGDGIGKTIVTGNRSVAGGFTTFSSSTFMVMGDGFMASGMTFRNTNGPYPQAVALLAGSDLAAFYRCSFEGYQDTLCVLSLRQFYRECTVYGTVDFVFGNAAAVLQNCTFKLRVPLHGEANVVAASGRTDPNQNTGIVVQGGVVQATAELRKLVGTVMSYLGRPWKQYGRAVFMECNLDGSINPAGWLRFVNTNFAISTVYFAEYNNFGAGASLAKRVNWTGYHVITSPAVARQFTVAQFIAGGMWLPSLGVPFTSGL